MNLNSAPSRSFRADALGTCFLASVNQHTISPQITMICSNFGPWQMFILFCMLERCGRHDNAFSFSYYRSSIDSSRLSEIQGIQHCPSYQDTWFCVITSFYGIVVSMDASCCPRCLDRFISVSSESLFHAYRKDVLWYLTYRLILDCALGAL